ncbi:J domain-containing protein [Asticcacaulis sp.]|uniref:J domain-containing protein n=1 Tax=Asticcacaulis sp. TaxID=1872648 RepID=UPI0031DE60D1
MAGDPYSELGVARNASAEDIQKAFRKLAKELHPDRNPNNKAAEDRFKRVSAAFDLLKDPEKRKKYDAGQMDADGRETYRSGFGGGGFGGGASQGYGAGARGSFDGIDLDDIFDIFGSGGGGRRTGFSPGGGFGAQAQKGSDLRIKLDIDLMDTIAGNTRRVQLTDGRTLDVTIPKGAKDGQTLRLKGQGAPSPNGRGPHGDALVELSLKPHGVFRVEGNDLHMDLYVSIPDAVLGGKVQAPTPDGPVNVTIAKGSNSGAILRLKGRGGYDGKTGARGDLFAHLVLALPDTLDPDFVAYAEDWRTQAPYLPTHPAMRKK